jgi:uncharacterized protein YutD
MKKIKLLEKDYELIKNYKNAFNKDTVTDLITNYFLDFDYIVGDFSYNKLRLKGFCNKNNKRLNKINDFDYIDNYIKENCAYDCGYFILRRI